MPFSPNAKRYLRGVAVALIGVLVAVLGITAVGFFGDYFAANPLQARLMLTGSLGIDILGAVVPVAVSFVATVLFIKSVNAPLKKLILTLSVSVFAAFLLYHLTTEGIAGSPLLLTLVASAVAGAVTVFPKPLVGLKENFVAALMLTLTCVPLSIFAVDLYYSRFFACAVIGGNGLADGLLLSALYAPLAVTALFSVLTYVSQTVLLVSNIRSDNAKPSPKMHCPVLSKNSNSQT